MAASAHEGDADLLQGLPPWANRKFMETILKRGEECPDIILQDVHFKRKATQDEGYASEIYFFSLRFVRQDADAGKNGSERSVVREISLLLKSLPSGGKHQEFICRSCAFPREMNMYNETIPLMCRLLEEAGRTPFAPKCYLCQENPRRVMILEDLTVTGHRLHPRRGLDSAHGAALLRKLAQFHAASAVLHQRDPASMELYRESHIVENEEARAHWGEVLSGMVRCLADEVRHWPGYGDADAHKLQRFADKLIEHLVEVFKRDEDGFNVLNHGDLWVNNTLFTYNSAEEVEDVRLIDYQSVHFSSPTIDLQYFLIVDPDDDARFHRREALLAEYHSELCDVLARLGYRRKVPSLAELEAELDRKVHHALFLAATDLAILLDDSFQFNSMIPSIGNETKKPNMHSSPKYKEIMLYLLPIFKAKGAL